MGHGYCNMALPILVFGKEIMPTEMNATKIIYLFGSTYLEIQLY